MYINRKYKYQKFMDNNDDDLKDKKLNSTIIISKLEYKNIYGILGNKYILISKIGKGLSSNVFLEKKQIIFLEK